MSKPEYEITKEDIATMLEYLRATAPKHATPERAIYLLEHYNIHYKKLEELTTSGDGYIDRPEGQSDSLGSACQRSCR